MNQENKSYQLTCLFPSSLNQEKIGAIAQKIKQLIIAEKGSISEIEGRLIEPIKKNLSYPIKKHLEAFYWNLNFLLSVQAINKLRQQLDSEKNIIRYLINAQETKTETVKKRISKKPLDDMVDKIEPLADKEQAQEKISSDKKEKVKIEELDKKLEEILNQ